MVTGKPLFSPARWQGLLFPRRGKVLCTTHLILRPPKMSDAVDFFAYARDERVARYVLWDAHQSRWESREALRAIRRRIRAQRALTFAICPRESGKLIGTIGPVWVDWDSQSCEVGFSMARAYWGQGLMAEALRAFLKYCFEDLGLNRVEGQHDLRNPASGRVMEKAGMACEGRLRQRVYYKGEYADVALYAVIRESWEAVGILHKNASLLVRDDPV